MHEAKNTRKKRQKQKLPAEKITDEKRRSRQISEAKKSAAKNARSKTLPEWIQMPHAKNTKSKKSQNLCIL